VAQKQLHSQETNCFTVLQAPVYSKIEASFHSIYTVFLQQKNPVLSAKLDRFHSENETITSCRLTSRFSRVKVHFLKRIEACSIARLKLTCQ